MDFYTDTGQMLFRTICRIKEMPDFVKSASIIDKESIPDRFFALPEKRAFPIADPAGTYLSFGYWLMDGNKLNNEEKERAKESIVKAAMFYGIQDDILDLAKKYKAVKAQLHEKKSSDNYGLPESKTWPLHTPAHVTMAIDHFPDNHKNYTFNERRQIAGGIVKKAEEFGIPIHTEIIVKYAEADPYCLGEQAAVNIAARALSAPTLDAKILYNKLGHGLLKSAADQEMLEKLAGVLEALDDHFGIVGQPDIIDTLFNLTEKQAQEIIDTVNIGGTNFPLNDLSMIPLDAWADMLGEDFAQSIQSEDKTADKKKIKDILPTLPKPDMNTLLQELNQYFASQGEQ